MQVVNIISLRALLLVPLVAALAACGGSGEEPATKEEAASV